MNKQTAKKEIQKMVTLVLDLGTYEDKREINRLIETNNIIGLVDYCGNWIKEKTEEYFEKGIK